MITARTRLFARIVAIVLTGCGAIAHAAFAIGAPSRIPQPVAQRLAALDCERVSASDVRDVLARAPAPRIVLLQGSVPLVTMEPFARFLADMGYPEDRLRFMLADSAAASATNGRLDVHDENVTLTLHARWPD